MRTPLLILLAALLLMAGCKSTKKLYDEGSYDRAVYSALDDLKKNPGNAVAQDILPKAYGEAVNRYEDNIAQARQGTVNEQKLDLIYREYAALQRMYSAIGATPAAQPLVSPKNYSAELSQATEEAAEFRYNKAMDLLQRGDRFSARRAYEYFRSVETYIPGYRDVAQRKAEAFNLSVINIVVDKFDQRFGDFSINGRFFQDDIVRNLNNIGRSHYYNFYDIRQPEAQELRVDQYMDINVYDISFGRLASNNYSYPVSREVTEKADRDSKESRTFTVTATVNVTRRIIECRGQMDYRITDAATRRLISFDRIPAQYTWEKLTGTYSGDSRALGDKDWAIVRGAFDRQPDYDDLYRELTSRIMNEFNNRMRNIYGH